MPVRVSLTEMLVRHLALEPEFSTEARSFGDLLDRVEAEHQGFRDSVTDETGAIRTYVNVFVNGRMLERHPRALSTRLSDGDEVYILASVAGG